MFDFAVKRLIKWQGVGFSKEIFETGGVFDRKIVDTKTKTQT